MPNHLIINIDELFFWEINKKFVHSIRNINFLNDSVCLNFNMLMQMKSIIT